MAQHLSVSSSAPKPGILDHLADGMSHVIARPYLAVVPIALDALFLTVPVISGASVGTSIGNRLQTIDSTVVNEFGAWLGRQGDWGIERSLALLVPSVVDGIASDSRYEPLNVGTVSPGALLGGALLVIAVLLSALIYMAFETWLAAASGLLEIDRRATFKAIAKSWLSLVSYGLLIAAVLTIVAAAMIVPSMLADRTIVSGDVVLGFLSLIGLVLFIGTLFVPEAIVLDGAGPIQAIRNSLHVLSENGWQSIGFFLVSLMIAPGLLSIWESISSDPAGLLLAILLNAAMVTSLAIASLGFYQARSRTAV